MSDKRIEAMSLVLSEALDEDGPQDWQDAKEYWRCKYRDLTHKALRAAVEVDDATIAAIRAELDTANFKAKAWDELWSACERWNDATAHRELEGKGRTVESLLDYAKQNKELREEAERLKGQTTLKNATIVGLESEMRRLKSLVVSAETELTQLREEVKGMKAILEVNSINPNQMVAPLCDHADLGNRDRCPKCGAYFP